VPTLFVSLVQTFRVVKRSRDARPLSKSPPDVSVPEVKEPVEEEKVPTIPEAYADNCENLDDKYLIIKNYTNRKGEVLTSKKVKVRHRPKRRIPYPNITHYIFIN
jgi:hypothetical protein